MTKKDPNILRSLQYFEAVVRHRSIRLAAVDLGVTQSAVSHQLRRFSETIGQQLLVKSGRGIALTPAGEKLGTRLVSAFANLDDLVNDIAGDGRQTLQIAICSTFGPGWLIERLDDFYTSYPDINLELCGKKNQMALIGRHWWSWYNTATSLGISPRRQRG